MQAHQRIVCMLRVLLVGADIHAPAPRRRGRHRCHHIGPSRKGEGPTVLTRDGTAGSCDWPTTSPLLTGVTTGIVITGTRGSGKTTLAVLLTAQHPSIGRVP